MSVGNVVWWILFTLLALFSFICFIFFLVARSDPNAIGVFGLAQTKCATCPVSPPCNTTQKDTQIAKLKTDLSTAQTQITQLQASVNDTPEYYYVDQYDVGGNDIKTIQGTVKQCISACHADPKCGAVVRKNVSGPNDNADCYLKASPTFDTRFKTYIAKRPNEQILLDTVIATG